MASQYDERGRLRHLLTLEDFDAARLEALLDAADAYLREPGELPARSDALAGRTVANLFFEPSTRTRASFELAARRLGADVLNLDVRTSSRAKGESLLDTIYTLQAMQCDIFVVRDAQPGIPEYIVGHAAPHVRVLNAGEGHVSHPTQGLLDVMTMRRHGKRFEGLRVAIIGDVTHSRVARSTSDALRALGTTDLRLAGPRELLPSKGDLPAALVTDDVDEAVTGADVVMALRIQKERMLESDIPNLGEYFQRFGLNADRLAKAAPDAIVMHPGPMNRGVEIASDVADGPQSVIEEQVTCGVAVRMAVMVEVMAG